jgi:hypothetical protein
LFVILLIFLIILCLVNCLSRFISWRFQVRCFQMGPGLEAHWAGPDWRMLLSPMLLGPKFRQTGEQGSPVGRVNCP